MWSQAARQSSLQARQGSGLAAGGGGGGGGGGGSLGGASAAQAQMGLQGAHAAQAAQAAAGGRKGGGGGRGGRGGGRGGRGGDLKVKITHQDGVNNVPRNMGVAPDPPLSNDYLYRNTVAASANAKPAANGLDRWVPEMNYG